MQLRHILPGRLLSCLFPALFLLLLFCGLACAAPTWTVLGSANFSAGEADYTSMAVASDNTPYVAYQDYGNGGKATVMKWSGTSWGAVGTAGFSTNGVTYTKLAFAPDGTLYIAFQDTVTSYPVVMKWSGSAWQTVGSITTPCIYPSIAFDSSSNPYLAFADTTTTTYFLKVMKYSVGSWSQVGGNVSAGTAYQVNMAIAPDGTPYVAYQDLDGGAGGATVKRYVSSVWSNVGSANLSAGQAGTVSMAFAPGDSNPYIAYAGDAAQGNKASVKKFNGTTWGFVGAQSFTSGSAWPLSLAISSSGTLYLAFADGSTGSKASAMTYNGSSWAAAGNADFSAGYADYPSLAIDSTGSLYVAYQDGSTGSYKATVMKLAAVVSQVPTVSGISPSSGPAAGGTSVTITGTNFNGATAVTIGGVSATGISVGSSTSITATTPAGTPGAASNVVVTTPSGTGTGTALFTYNAAPTINSLSVNHGPTTGGTSVTITGNGFVSGATVTIGGTAATGVTWNSATSITAVTPSGTGINKNVVVTNPDLQSGTLTGGFSYDVPTVTGIAPNGGLVTGGGSVTITGTNFTGATSVTIGGTSATDVTVVSATSITATVPAGTAGSKNVVVTTPSGSGTGTGIYTYYDLPVVTGVSPASGTTGGGTSVTITGIGFNSVTVVKFGSSNAASYTVNSPTQITATSPAGSAGIVDVTVTAYGVTSATRAADGFTYLAASIPTVSGISPSTGPVSGGTAVTITGTNFSGATAVLFGSNIAIFAVNSATQITALSPLGGSGSTDITVVTPGGTSATGAADRFTYAASTSAILLDPNSASTLFAGLDGGGIYKSTDSGSSWGATTGLPANSRVKAMVMKDSANLYAAVYGSGVYKSITSGDSWSACGVTGLTNTNLLSLEIDGNGSLYAGTENGIFSSADGCGSWTAMNNGLPN